MRTVLVGLILVFGLGNAKAASFDCNKAKRPTEIITCQDPTLSKIDGYMGRLFKDLRSILPPAQGRSLVKEQVKWLWAREAACGMDKSDALELQFRNAKRECLLRRTKQRVRVLEQRYKVAKGASHPLKRGAEQKRPASMVFRLRGNGRNCAGCSWISAEGKITLNTPKKFIHFLTKVHPWHPPDVVFHSNGGNLYAALQLGRIIRRYGLRTNVGKSEKDGDWDRQKSGHCFSACAFAFLGGVSRFAEEGEIGVHQFFAARLSVSKQRSEAETRVVDQLIFSRLIKYVHDMGVSSLFLKISSETFPDRIRRLRKAELKKLRVTSLRTSRQTGWLLKAHGDGWVLQSAVIEKRDGTIVDGSEVYIYCKLGKQRRYYVSFSFMARGRKAEDFGDPSDSSLFRHYLHIGERRIQINKRMSKYGTARNGSVYFVVPIREDEFDQIYTSKSIGFQISLPRALGIERSWDFRFKKSPKKLNIVRRNCIKVR